MSLGVGSLEYQVKFLESDVEIEVSITYRSKSVTLSQESLLQGEGLEAETPVRSFFCIAPGRT